MTQDTLTDDASTDSDLETFATIRDTAQNLTRMVRIASAGIHDDVYMRVHDGAVHFNTQYGGRQVMSYCTFTGLKEVSGDAEAILPVGLDNDTKGFLDYLGIAEGDGTMELRLLGVEGDDGDDHPRLASYWEAEGALEATIRLPGSAEDLKQVPWELPNRFVGEDQRYVSRSALDDDGDLAIDPADAADHASPTIIETTADTVRKQIIEPANFMDDVNYYPVIKRGDDFVLDLQGQAGDDSLRGVVNAERVEGPDVDRTFDVGFEELFGELEGPVRLATAPEPDGDGPSPPLVVVQSGHRSGETVRHVLGPFTEE